MQIGGTLYISTDNRNYVVVRFKAKAANLEGVREVIIQVLTCVGSIPYFNLHKRNIVLASFY